MKRASALWSGCGRLDSRRRAWRWSLVAVAIPLLSVAACREKVTMKISVRTADAGLASTRTATASEAPPPAR